MSHLQKSYKAWLERIRSKGGDKRLAHFFCPQCSAAIQTLKPPHAQVWDSLGSCPACEAVFFRKVFCDGRVEISDMTRHARRLRTTLAQESGA